MDDRWDRLFEDLMRWEPETWDPEEVSELARAELVDVLLAERVIGTLGVRVTATSRTGETIVGEVLAAADTWCALRNDTADTVVRYAALTSIHPLGRPRPGSRPVPLGVVLRRLQAAGGAVVLDGRTRGIIRAVARDHIDVRTESGSVVTIPTAALGTVRAPRGSL